MDDFVKDQLDILACRSLNARPLMVVSRGSTVWGDGMPDSDRDMAILFDWDPAQYISINQPNQVLNWKHEGCDVEAMELSKAMSLLSKGNMNVLMWLCVGGMHRHFLTNRAQALLDNTDRFIHHGLVRHLFGMARSMMRKRSTFGHPLGLKAARYETKAYVLLRALAEGKPLTYQYPWWVAGQLKEARRWGTLSVGMEQWLDNEFTELSALRDQMSSRVACPGQINQILRLVVQSPLDKSDTDWYVE